MEFIVTISFKMDIYMNKLFLFLRIIVGILFILLSLSVLNSSCSKPTKGTGEPTEILPPPSDLQSPPINGTEIMQGNNLVGLVYDLDTGEGIPNVPITDGLNYTVTDNNGVYQFKSTPVTQLVYMSVPAEYEINLNNDTHLPEFYSKNAISHDKINRNDFALKRLPEPEEDFTLVMIGDPQCKTKADVSRYVSETIPDIRSTLMDAQAKGKYKNAYAITLGDIIYDDPSQWDAMELSMSNVKLEEKYLPFFNCIGNHDHELGTLDDVAAKRKYVDKFGPTDYSFNRGHAHIVVMDNILYYRTTANSKREYDAGFSKEQLDWLKKDISYVKDKENKLLVFCCHIPFRSGGNDGNGQVNFSNYYSEFLTLFTEFKEVHIMSGHLHYPLNYIHKRICKGGTPIYEHTLGAACGAWWDCNLNTNGAPNGYSIFEISGASMSNWVAKGTGMPEDVQMRAYDGNQVYTGNKGYEFYWYKDIVVSDKVEVKGLKALEDCFVVKVWNADDAYWRLDFIKDGKSTMMSRVSSGLADMCVVSFYFNELGKKTDTWIKPQKNIWYIKAPCGEPSKETGWEIRATQTIPSTGKTNVYSVTELHTDYSGF